MTEAKKLPGRPGSGLPANEVMKQATKNRRDRLLKEGKQDFKTFLDPETKEHLQLLKTLMEVRTTGDVIDVLVQQEIKRRKSLIDTLK